VYTTTGCPSKSINKRKHSDLTVGQRRFSNAERLIKAKRHYDPENVFRSAIPLPVALTSLTSKSNPALISSARRMAAKIHSSRLPNAPPQEA
jgi:hypothetical protein